MQYDPKLQYFKRCTVRKINTAHFFNEYISEEASDITHKKNHVGNDFSNPIKKKQTSQ